MLYTFIDEKQFDNRADYLRDISAQFLDRDYLSQQNFVLVLIVLLNYSSCEEFVNLGFSYRLISKYIRILKKNGYIEKLPIELKSNHRVSCTDDLFTFTKQGYDSVKYSLCGDKVLNAYSYKKTFEDIHSLHTYLLGMNLVESLLGLNNKRFNWEREVCLSDKKRTKYSFVSDCKISFSDFEVYFEEDLGNEKNEIVLNKLLGYYSNKGSLSDSYPILSAKNNKTAIVFSYYQPRKQGWKAISQGKINDLVDALWNIEDNTSILKIDPAKLSLDNQRTLKAIIAEFLDPKNNMYIPQTERFTVPTNTWKNDCQKRYNELTVSNLREMKNKYSVENPFFLETFRKKQYLSFIAKRENLHELFMKERFGRYKNIYDEVRAGYPIYLVPTSLLSRYIRFVSEFSSYYNNISRCLESYFGKPDYSSYKSSDVVGQVDNGMFCLRNTISTGNCILCIEYPTIDFMAIERIHLFYYYIHNTTKPTQLIIIVDFYQEAYRISCEIKDYWQFSKLRKISKNTYCYDISMKTSNIFFITRKDLEEGRSNSLFFVSGRVETTDSDGKPTVLEENRYCKLVPGRFTNY